jgi:hypothetical protein
MGLRGGVGCGSESLLSFSLSGPRLSDNRVQRGSLPSPWTAQGRDFGKMTPGWPATMHTPEWIVIRPAPTTLKPFGDAKIDPMIIVHPSRTRIGDQPPGTQIAQNQFPGLKLLPIEWPQLKIKPIPTVWPNLKMEPIATTCAKCTMVSVGTSAQAVAASSAK